MKRISIVALSIVTLGLLSWIVEESDAPGYINWEASSKMYNAEGSFKNWTVENVVYNPDSIENTTLDIVVGVASVHEKSDKLVEHLKADDYFDIAVFPNATIHVQDIQKTDTAYSANFIVTIKDVVDTTEAYFTVDNSDPLIVTGYTYIDRPKHLIGLPLKKTKGITEQVKVDFQLDMSLIKE